MIYYGIYVKTLRCLVCHFAFETKLADTVSDGVEFFVGGFGETGDRGVAVDGVDHHFARRNLLDGVEPRRYEVVSHIGNTLALIFAVHEHGLDDAAIAEGDEALYDVSDIVAFVGLVD